MLDKASPAYSSKIDSVSLAKENLKRPYVKGKFLFIDDEKFWVRGVTYGTFSPDDNGTNYPEPAVVKGDFAAIKRAGLNALRLYTVPPLWLLDIAAAHGLRIMIGLPWEQHITFLDDKARALEIINGLRDAIRPCLGHPAVLCYAIGNEIPAPVVRWHGRRAIEKFLARLCDAVKKEDPGGLVTYVNYPTTEYLELPFLDFFAFNVYLEKREQLRSYLAHLQNLAGERPLLLTEIGLDSRRNGEEAQAVSLKWQIEASFEKGCAGAFVFAWTDEWHRGGHDIEDWDFGLTSRDRQPKPALKAVAEAFEELPFPSSKNWPRISVVVCSYNGSATIGETLAALIRLNYQDYEIIVVDDGSTDATAEIARKYAVSLIQTENKGLSNARNLGMDAATGEIIAYIDDDAYPDPDWLQFLAASFMSSDHVGLGGPNIAPPGDGFAAEAVAHAPGGPVHVLLSEEVAEHIPGCNMAYRLDRLRAIGGFDKRFKVAGDDVDVCWRLQERGWTLGFSPGAVVWHHRRKSFGTYWKQQKGYAHAEALLAEKWPQKYNAAGHLNWSGRLYGKGIADFFMSRSKVYHGIWGCSPFQSIYEPARGILLSLPLMPEWYFLVALLGALGVLGLTWQPLLLISVPFFLAAAAASFVQAGMAAATQTLDARPRRQRLALRLSIAWLHLIQPLARLFGRVWHGVAPWRWANLLAKPALVERKCAIWSEDWQPLEGRLAEIERLLMLKREVVIRGGEFDRWDLEVRGGLFGLVRAVGMVEEHGAGNQLFRLRAWPYVPRPVIVMMSLLAFLAVFATYDGAGFAAIGLGVMALIIALTARAECASAMEIWRGAVKAYAERRDSPPDKNCKIADDAAAPIHSL